MGLRERVALILVTVIITEISILQCLPIAPKKAPVNRYLDNYMKTKGMKSVLPVKGYQSSKSIYSNGNTAKTKDAPSKKSICKAYNFPEMEYMSAEYKNPFHSEANANTYEPIVKNIDNPQTKAVDDFKKQLRLKRKLNRVNYNANHQIKSKPQQFSNIPQVYGEDTFPEELFPVNAMETWAPNYWPTTMKEKEQNYDMPELPMYNSKATEICKQKPFNRRFKSKTQHFMEEMDKWKKKMRRPTIKNMTEDSTTKVNTDGEAGDLMKPVLNSTNLPTSQETDPVTTQIESDLFPVTPLPFFIANNSCPFELNATKNENIEANKALVDNPEGQNKCPNMSPESYYPELGKIPSVSNETEKNQENSMETLTNKVNANGREQNSEKKDTGSVLPDPLNMNIPLPLTKDIADGNEPDNNVTILKAPYKSIIVVPVGDSVQEIQIPVADATTDSQIILIIPTTSRTDNDMLSKLVNISCITEIVSNTPVNNVSNIAAISEVLQAGTFHPGVMTDPPLAVKEYILENSNISSKDLLVLDFEKLPNNSMCHEIRNSPSHTPLDGIPPNEKLAISPSDILPSNVQNMDQASSINNSTDVASSILSPSVISDEYTNNEDWPTHSDEENSSQSNIANDTPFLVDNTPENIISDTNPAKITEDILQPEEDIDIRAAPDIDEQSLPFNNENKDDEQSNNLDSDSDADQDNKIAPVSDIQEDPLPLLNDTDNADNTTSTSDDESNDEPLSDKEDVGHIKDLPTPPISSKLEDYSDHSAVDSPLPSKVVNSEKNTDDPIEDVLPINDELSDESGPDVSQDVYQSEIPITESNITPPINQIGIPITDKIDIIEPQTKELPEIGPTEVDNSVSIPNIDDPKDNTDILMPANDPISDTLPVEITDDIKENGVTDHETDLNYSKLPDQPLVDDIYTILPVETLTPDILTDNTKLSNPDSQSPLPSAIESSDPSPLNEANTATLPNGIENNDLLPIEEGIPDINKDHISPELPLVSDILTDNTKLSNPDSQSPLPSAIESSDPSPLNEANTATLPNGIENNDLLPIEEGIPDINKDHISPELPLVSDILTDNTKLSNPDSQSPLPSAIESSDPSPLNEANTATLPNGIENNDPLAIEEVIPDTNKYHISPEVPLVSDIFTDNTKLSNPDIQSPLPSAIESSDPSPLDEANTATLPNGIENNDLLPIEEVIPDTNKDHISPEVPLVSDGLDGLSDGVPTSVAESQTLPTDEDLSSAELTNLIKYLYANV